MTPQRCIRAHMAVIKRWRVRRRKVNKQLSAAADAYLAKCGAAEETPNATDFLASIVDSRLRAMFKEPKP